MKRLIIIPTYNESINAPVLVKRISRFIPQSEILVIDDGSPDGTAKIIESLQQSFPNLHLLQRGEKSGLGSAYRIGFAWALERNYTEIIEMDADLSHRVRDLAKMIEAKENNPNTSLIIGSRWTKGGKTENWSIGRKLLSRSANVYVRLMLGMGVKDSTAGFRIYSADILRKINFSAFKSEGYSFQIEMTRSVHMCGGSIIEVPIIFREREQGVSKMSKEIIREAMKLVSIWGIMRATQRVKNSLYRLPFGNSLHKQLTLLMLRTKRRDFVLLNLINEFILSRNSDDKSQFGEQEILSELVPTAGQYIDIGAGLPVSGSNTYFLYKAGWKGVAVDPLLRSQIFSKILRPRDKFLRCAVGETTSGYFYEFYPYQFSTLSYDVAHNLISRSRAILLRKSKIDVISLNDIYKYAKDGTFTFLNIDTEGLDLEVIKSLDFRRFKPNIICIEDWYYARHGASQIHDFLTGESYILYANKGVSSIYLKH
jgi:dolichol-phosphate mannosyltransferase